MKHLLFRTLSTLNKKLLPSYIHRDLTRLNNVDKAIVGFKIWVTKNYLDAKERRE